MTFYLAKEIQDSYESVLERLESLLKTHGYIIASKINVQKVLSTKLGVEIAKTCMIGTNKPEIGYQIFSNDPNMGVLLPFSIVVQEASDRHVNVAVIDPECLFALAAIPELNVLASKIKSVFKQVLDKL